MSHDDLIRYYSKRAAEFEEIYRKPERQKDLAALKLIVGEFATGNDVLEIACGTGYWTEVMAPSARSIVATDASPEVLEIARRKTYPEGRVRFVQADAFDMSAVAGRFTSAFAGFWWSHVPRERIPAFLRTLHSRLEPGDRVLFTDNRSVAGSSTPVSRTDALGNTYQLRRLEDGSEHEVIKNFPTSPELRDAVVGLGSEISIVELEYYWCLQYVTRDQG